VFSAALLGGVTFAALCAGGDPAPRATEVPARIGSAVPAYPAAAAARHLRGPVVLRLTVDTTGRVAHAAVARGDGLLVTAALSAARRWTFAPPHASVRIIAGINIEPPDVSTAATISPPPLIDSNTTAAARPDADPKARLLLMIGPTGRVVDAIGLSGSEHALIAATDTALRWYTQPLIVNGRAIGYECGADWFNPGAVRVGSAILRRAQCYTTPADGDAAKPGILEVLIDAEGLVERAKVLRSNPAFDEQALAAVKQWRYGPLFLHGVSVPTIETAVIPVRR